ncbi:MAG: hypothetical protein M5R36_17020 [Deltaproteobacteria bacterium]|nr:hypothetical protein [Deltaproteobacteria bacterium]
MTAFSAGTRWAMRLFVVVAAASITILASDAAVRIAKPDVPPLKGFLYRQFTDRQSHRYDPNPEILFPPQPGRAKYQAHTVTINEHGARGPSRPAAKPSGTFRIMVLGGSNVYGAFLNDDKTWPAQLEARLDEIAGRPVEVWNFGTSAYVGAQMAALGREATQKLDPDVVIVALSNSGPKAIFEELRVSDADFLAKHRWIWPAMRRAEDPYVARVAGSALKETLLEKSALYRYLAIRYLRKKFAGSLLRLTSRTPQCGSRPPLRRGGAAKNATLFFYLPGGKA